MSILNFLLLYWDSVLLVAVLLAVLIVLYVKGEKRILDLIMFAAITEAERQYKSGTGPLKKSSVITKIYSVIPVILKIIISEDQIGRWIETALAAAKMKWAENTAIENYIKGDTSTDLPS